MSCTGVALLPYRLKFVLGVCEPRLGDTRARLGGVRPLPLGVRA